MTLPALDAFSAFKMAYRCEPTLKFLKSCSHKNTIVGQHSSEYGMPKASVPTAPQQRLRRREVDVDWHGTNACDLRQTRRGWNASQATVLRWRREFGSL